MLRVGFEPTMPVIKRAKTIHALDRAAVLIAKRFTVVAEIKTSVHTIKIIANTESNSLKSVIQDIE
jgi:hypothetical protein